MKFKIGDKVRIRKDLTDGMHYKMEDSGTYNTATRSMIEHAGEVFEITGYKGKQYSVEGPWDDFLGWTDEMFEDVYTKFNSGDVVRLKRNAKLEDLLGNYWCGCQGDAIKFIKLADGRQEFKVDSCSVCSSGIFAPLDMNPMFYATVCIPGQSNLNVPCNILELVDTVPLPEPKEEVLELTVDEVSSKYGKKVKIIGDR